MANFTVLGALLIKYFWIILAFIFLLFVIKNRKQIKKLLLFLCLFLISLAIGIYCYATTIDDKNAAAKKFIGYYKLDKLNRQECNNCKLNLLPDYHFDIIRNDTVIGSSKWDLNIDYEEVGYFLVIDGGPRWIIDDSKREIDFLMYPSSLKDSN